MKHLLAVLVFALIVVAPSAQAAPQKGDVIIRHVTLIDVESEVALNNQAVVLKGDDIAAVGPDTAIARDWQAKQTIDGTARYLIPGLWDMHVHFGGGPELIKENEALLPLYVAHGITAIRDASGDIPEQVLAWRDDIAAGRKFGPRLFTSGAKIEGIAPLWKGTIEVGSEEDVDNALARLQQHDKVNFVKITDSTLKPELFLYALRQAKALGMRTSGHIPMALTVGQAVDAGISSIEHLDYAYKAGAKDEAAIAADYAAGLINRTEANRRIDASFDVATAMRSYRHFAEAGVFVTPTLNGSRIISWLDSETHADDPYLAYIGPKLRETYNWRVERAAKADAAAIAARHDHFDRVAAILPMLAEAGVTIIAGTDAGFLNSFNYPGVGLHDEIALFVDRGLTAPQALASTTRAGPAWFGMLDRYGAIRPGMAADLVLLDHNPLENISATRAIHAVVLRGRVFDRPALDKMLSDTRAQVAEWNLLNAAP